MYVSSHVLNRKNSKLIFACGSLPAIGEKDFTSTWSSKGMNHKASSIIVETRSLDTLINEEAHFLAQYLRSEKQSRIPRLVSV